MPKSRAIDYEYRNNVALLLTQKAKNIQGLPIRERTKIFNNLYQIVEQISSKYSSKMTIGLIQAIDYLPLHDQPDAIACLCQYIDQIKGAGGGLELMHRLADGRVRSADMLQHYPKAARLKAFIVISNNFHKI